MTDVSARNRTQGRFAPENHPVSTVTLEPATGASPASVLAAAVDSDKNPNSIPWPDQPANKGYVEVNVSDDDARDVLERHGYDGEVVNGYQQVYAAMFLADARDADFHGVKADGSTDYIAGGIRDYEQAVDPFQHESLDYREGYSDPMPPYLAAQDDVRAQRLEAAAELLEESGVGVELHDLQRHQFRLKSAGADDLQLEVRDFQLPKLVETRNWRTADDTHLAAFLGDGYTPEAGKLLSDCASLVARGQLKQAYQAAHAK